MEGDVPGKPQTLEDIGREAGVSGKTVSRVLHGDPHVSAATRKRVEAAIATAGFRPNLAARTLAAARSYLIGTFAPGTAFFYNSQLHIGAAHACRQLGYHLVIDELNPTTPSAVDHYQRGLARAGCAGLLLPPPVCDDLALLDVLDGDGMPYVRIAPQHATKRSSAVFADDEAGMIALVRYLWERGHRRFGVVAGPSGYSSTAIRRDTFVAAVVAAGGAAADVAVASFEWRGSSARAAHRAAAELLERSDPPTAISAFDDQIAAGVIGYAFRKGLQVPDDLAVAGFDDSDIAQLIWPPLTTVRQPIAAMAEQAVRVLISGRSRDDEIIRCPVNLIVRGSA